MKTFNMRETNGERVMKTIWNTHTVSPYVTLVVVDLYDDVSEFGNSNYEWERKQTIKLWVIEQKIGVVLMREDGTVARVQFGDDM